MSTVSQLCDKEVCRKAGLSENFLAFKLMSSGQKALRMV